MTANWCGLLPVDAVFDGHDPYRAGNDPAFAPSEAASSRFRIQDARVPAFSGNRPVGTSGQRGTNASATLALWPAGSDAGVMAGELISGGHRALSPGLAPRGLGRRRVWTAALSWFTVPPGRS